MFSSSANAPIQFAAVGAVAPEAMREQHAAEVVELSDLGRWADAMGARMTISALAEMPRLRHLHLRNGAGLDLSPLAELPGLTELTLSGCRASVAFPSTLPAGLQRLTVTNTDPDEIECLVARVAWERCGPLRSITLEVAPGFGPAALDLGFLAHLHHVSAIVLRGIQHVARRPSPLQPPFDGLPGSVARGSLEFDAGSPEGIAEALGELLGGAGRVLVHPAPWRGTGAQAPGDEV